MTGVDELAEAYAQAGWLGLAAVAVTLSLRIYRRPSVQAVLPPQWRWNALPRVYHWVIVAAVSGAASAFTAVSTGMSWRAAIVAAIPVAIAAITGHQTTKAIGHKHTAECIRKHGVTYEPGRARRALDIVIPLDSETLAQTRSLNDAARRAADGERFDS